MSPLHNQKLLRLDEKRRLMLFQNSVSAAGPSLIQAACRTAGRGTYLR